MTTVSLSPDLAGLYFEITNRIDQGATTRVEETQAAIEEGYVMKLLGRSPKIDLSLYDSEERVAINRLFQTHAADRSKRLGYHNNGLAYAAGVLVQIMVHGEWEHPDTGEQIDVSSLECEIR